MGELWMMAGTETLSPYPITSKIKDQKQEKCVGQCGI